MLVLLGEAPNPAGIGHGLQLALAARALGQRGEFRSNPGMWLRGLARKDQPLAKLLLSIRHVNLLDHWPGKSGKGSYFPQAMAAARAKELVLPAGTDMVMLAGKRVARACGLVHPDYFEPYHGAPTRLAARCPVVTVPHPSGVCTWWNSWDNRMKAAAFLEQLVERKSPKGTGK